MIRTLVLAAGIVGSLGPVQSALALGPSFDREQTRASLTATAPDVVERSILAKQSELTTTLDARERSLVARSEARQAAITTSDAFTRAIGSRAVSAAATPSSDALTRALGNRVGASEPFVDDRFRIGTVAAPAPVSATGSHIEWPQIGVGIGIGIALVLGLGLALRLARPRREFAH